MTTERNEAVFGSPRRLIFKYLFKYLMAVGGANRDADGMSAVVGAYGLARANHARPRVHRDGYERH